MTIFDDIYILSKSYFNITQMLCLSVCSLKFRKRYSVTVEKKWYDVLLLTAVMKIVWAVTLLM